MPEMLKSICHRLPPEIIFWCNLMILKLKCVYFVLFASKYIYIGYFLYFVYVKKYMPPVTPPISIHKWP